MIYIKFLFWNIFNKNLILPIIDIILENEIDVVALVEAKKLDVCETISVLKERGQQWKELSICPVDDIVMMTKAEVCASVLCEEHNYSTYKIKYNNDYILYNVVHLPSAMHKEEEARNLIASRISDYLRKKEEEFSAIEVVNAECL